MFYIDLNNKEVHSQSFAYKPPGAGPVQGQCVEPAEGNQRAGALPDQQPQRAVHPALPVLGGAL